MTSGVGYPKENMHFYEKLWQYNYSILLKSNFKGMLQVAIVLKMM